MPLVEHRKICLAPCLLNTFIAFQVLDYAVSLVGLHGERLVQWLYLGCFFLGICSVLDSICKEYGQPGRSSRIVRSA